MALALGATGCSYKVRLLSEPVGALVVLPDGTETVTPTEVKFRWGKRQLVRVEYEGYRTLVVDMQRTEGRFLRFTGAALFQAGGREVTFRLVPEHGPVGTWETEDAGGE